MWLATAPSQVAGKTIDQLLSTLSYEDEVRLIADPIQVNR